MNHEGIENTIDGMDINDILTLRKIATKQIKKLRKSKTKKIQTFIPATKHNELIRAQKWAFDKGLIEKDTLYGFSKFAILNTVDMIIKQIIIEEKNNEMFGNKTDIQNEPNSPQVYKYHDNVEPHTGSAESGI
uniref:Uncharacterized protein n=1 Tax=viral metagenome TaxID=1070528 RepID=A0A6M3Y5S2_9ZZZZ